MLERAKHIFLKTLETILFPPIVTNQSTDQPINQSIVVLITLGEREGGGGGGSSEMGFELMISDCFRGKLDMGWIPRSINYCISTAVADPTININIITIYNKTGTVHAGTFNMPTSYQ